MPCFLTATGAYLPGVSVNNNRIADYLGSLEGEAEVAKSVLAMNGIVGRHYAQDERQRPTHDVYDLATRAAKACLAEAAPIVADHVSWRRARPMRRLPGQELRRSCIIACKPRV